MISSNFSRRSFLTRLGAGTAGLVGSSLVGGAFTRAWAGPLHSLRANRFPVGDGKPKSIVLVGPAESLRREHRAYQLPEVQVLVRDLTRRGFERVGDPQGVDGVAGYVSGGGHAVGLGFAKGGGDAPTVTLVARWWDEARLSCDLGESMPDVYYHEKVGGSGTTALVRFRYVDDKGDLATREEVVNVSDVPDACAPSCHAHPPGACPPECGAVCTHCEGYTNTCYVQDPDCMQQCTLCPHCFFVNHWAYALLCVTVCYSFCEQRCAGTYCCDYIDRACCFEEVGGIPLIPHCT